MDNAEKDIWEKICTIYQKTKEIALLSEEFSRTKSPDLQIDLNTFIQPINELKHAHDHIMRVRSIELKLHKTTDPDYTVKNLRKALGHEYRAFFDTADYFSIIIREDIQLILEPYNSGIISQVLPDYYTTIRPSITAISTEIAEIRMQKDIGQEGALKEPVDHYTELLKNLVAIHNGLVPCIPTLEELKREERSKERKNWLKNFLLLIIGGAIAGFFGWIFNRSPK